jgi:hypothetical protein
MLLCLLYYLLTTYDFIIESRIEAVENQLWLLAIDS